MKEVPHLEIRKKIYKLLISNPGLNLSKISEILHISVALADYHLHYMEENELITTSKEGGYKRYYIRGKIGTEDKKLLSILQQEIPLKIVVFLINYPNAKPNMIKEEIEISSALLTYYLKKLVKYNIISETPTGEKKGYYIVDKEQITRLLIRYKRNVLLERFKDTWLSDIPLSGKVSDKKKKE